MPLRLPSYFNRLPPRLWVVIMLLVVWPVPRAGAQATREYDLKAVFLFNFASFVEWPESARPKAGQPIIIGVLGRDPFGRLLDEVVAGEKIREHPLEIHRYRTVESAQECHILYISPSEAWRLTQILRFLQDKPVLTVADTPRPAESEAIITFSTGARVELHVKLASAERAGLNISSKLLRVSNVVGWSEAP